ncbi:MAG: DUF362 domain-containing protein [Spirochaetales bacterium]|nr:DUF362 domain-containing protein [Spirochaetales bacterium]
MGIVGIVGTGNDIRESLEEALGLVGGLGNYICRNDSVILKPNINGSDLVTRPALVEALIRILLDYGIRRISIAESSFGNAGITDAYFKATGYTRLAETCGIPLVNLNRSRAKTLTVEQPLALDTIDVAEEIFAADKLINLPVMKVHYATGISLALKNLKGILVCGEKRRFHEAGLHAAIADLNNTVKPNLTIVDATSCMEGMGPHGGDIVDLNVILAGRNSWEIDCIGCGVMGYGIDEVRHLAEYCTSNHITAHDMQSIDVRGRRVEEVAYPFKKVNVEAIVPLQFTVCGTNACSACMNAFLVSCKLLTTAPRKEITVFLGNRHGSADVKTKKAVAFGNCAVKSLCRGDGDMGRIRGCPPYPFRLGEYLDSV